jgi:hypothetical protein
MKPLDAETSEITCGYDMVQRGWYGTKERGRKLSWHATKKRKYFTNGLTDVIVVGWGAESGWENENTFDGGLQTGCRGCCSWPARDSFSNKATGIFVSFFSESDMGIASQLMGASLNSLAPVEGTFDFSRIFCTAEAFSGLPRGSMGVIISSRRIIERTVANSALVASSCVSFSTKISEIMEPGKDRRM